MKQFTAIQRTVSCLLKGIIFFSALIGTFLSYYAGRNSFMGGSTVFMYFTIQSNLAVAIIAALGLRKMMKFRSFSNIWYVITFVGTIAITLTGAVFCFVLAPTMGNSAWNIQNVLTHVVVPVSSIVDFFVVAVNGFLKKKHVFYVIFPPLMYAIYAGIGYVCGWQFALDQNYPYFFLNWGSPAGAWGFTNELPFMGCGWWILLLLILLIVVGLLYLLIVDSLKKLIYRS